MNDIEKSHAHGKQRACHDESALSLPSVSRLVFRGKTLMILAAVVLAAITAFSLLYTSSVVANTGDPQKDRNLGSPDFANPPEVRSRPSEKRLRAVVEINSGEYMIPNVGKEQMRQYRGWDAARPRPHPGTSVSPGPTLRARLGDQVQIAFLNRIDDRRFSYSFDTNSPPGYSSYGCDKVDNPKATGFVYPGNDKFPNCFHGSSTANIHFHGTHTDPDGLGDNVLVQVLPQMNQPDWTATFNQIFNSRKIPQRWADLPLNYRAAQQKMIQAHDASAKAAAIKNGLRPPDPLWAKNAELIAHGDWPQYFVGAFPNFFEIPDYDTGKYKAGQAPGTHWYHSHKHGSTSLHILNGLAGALVIESNKPGGYDHVIRDYYGWGDSYGDHEKIFVFQEFDSTQNLERGGPGGKGIDQVLVNGLFQPTITMKTGEVQLWRMVNATTGNGPGKLSPDLFKNEDFKFKQTAQDGVQFSPDNYKDQPFLTSKVPGGLALAAGNRADLLVQAPKGEGVYAFKTVRPNGTTATLFFVKVIKGDVKLPPTGAFPVKWAEMPKYLQDLRPPGPNDIRNPGSPVKFQWEAGRTKTGPNPNPPHFMINNKQFGETGEVIDQCMPKDGLQDWVLENWTSTPHPFHIHINPFQVIRIDTPTGQNKYSIYEPKDNFVWQDVISIPPAVISSDGKQITPGRITIRQTYPDFTGTFVLHCHILAHEDRGMMQLVRIVPRADYPRGCQDAVPAHH